MADSKLRELQLLELEILLELDKFCKKHDIKYYLAEGTLLGAVRHKGFIPWDDDVDVMMPRKDYEKFLKLAVEHFNDDYHVQCISTEPKYWVLAAKIRMKKKTGFEQKNLEKMTKYNGVYIDVFPLDYLPKAYSSKFARTHKVLRILRRMLWLKTGFSRKKRFRNKILKVFAVLIPVKTYHKLLKKIMTRFNKNKHNYIVNYGSYYALPKKIFPIHTFGEGTYLEFENHKFPVPNDYDYILTTIYGDYMELPPEEKRKHKHTINIEEPQDE